MKWPWAQVPDWHLIIYMHMHVSLVCANTAWEHPPDTYNNKLTKMIDDLIVNCLRANFVGPFLSNIDREETSTQSKHEFLSHILYKTSLFCRAEQSNTLRGFIRQCWAYDSDEGTQELFQHWAVGRAVDKTQWQINENETPWAPKAQSSIRRHWVCWKERSPLNWQTNEELLFCTLCSLRNCNG